MIIIYMQEGTQAIHISAAAGHLHIVKELIEKYDVPPNAATNVCIHIASYIAIFRFRKAKIVKFGKINFSD